MSPMLNSKWNGIFNLVLGTLILVALSKEIAISLDAGMPIFHFPTRSFGDIEVKGLAALVGWLLLAIFGVGFSISGWRILEASKKQ